MYLSGLLITDHNFTNVLLKQIFVQTDYKNLIVQNENKDKFIEFLLTR